MASLASTSWLSLGLLAGLASGTAIAAENGGTTHPAVEAALSWQLPENPCEKPRTQGMPQPQEINQGGGGDAAVWDVDHYTYERYQRKENRWKSCLAEYRQTLQSDFQGLMDSAQHGLTQSQAETILGKLREIQDALEALPP